MRNVCYSITPIITVYKKYPCRVPQGYLFFIMVLVERGYKLLKRGQAVPQYILYQIPADGYEE